MTDTALLPPMYAGPAIQFRDPFVSSRDSPPQTCPQQSAVWSAPAPYSHVTRPLTPPPEMAGAYAAVEPIHPANLHDHKHSEYERGQQVYRGPVPAPAREALGTTAHSNGQSSPYRQRNWEAPDEMPPHRRGSQHSNAIASPFQIPRSVNDSGGSLAELAAQITCLFWFESSESLQQVEESSHVLVPTRPLVTDAKPTTGFRKWVTTILSTTCVAQNVVILALLFIYRLKKLNPTVRGKPGSEYRLLTVALMLGNKFLDDNTYTNKTWAEVSGINVAEVHIMEVEFLSNMKYCLFTSEPDWARWQSLLGKFASFFDRASRPQPQLPPLPTLLPASTMPLPGALPSPPTSNQASPPHMTDGVQNAPFFSNAGLHGSTPAPSPGHSQPASRKRARDEAVMEAASKRIAGSYQRYTSPNRYLAIPANQSHGHSASRLTLPSLAIPTSQPSASGYGQSVTHSQGLPPLGVPARGMVMPYPSSSSQPPPMTMPAASASHTGAYAYSQVPSRQQSPYGGTIVPSPSSAAPHSGTGQVSPDYYLRSRNSPYRPVHHVSTLLYPPPTAATEARPSNIALNQMQYQPLGKPTQQHNGRLPYLCQNLWLDGNHPQEMTPIHQWPHFPPQTLPSVSMH